MLLFLDFSTTLVSNKLLVWNTTVMYSSEFYVLLFNNNTIASHKHEAMEKQPAMKKRYITALQWQFQLKPRT